MSAKMTIIEGNSNDKDNVRAYMVKGEPGKDGVSPSASVSQDGEKAIITVTDAEGTTTAEVNAGISPTVEVSKTAGVTTLTITDYEGTHTATINDGETYEIPTNSIIGFDGDTIPGGYEEVNEVPISATVLYESETGSNANITLTDSADNYEYIEIFAHRVSNNFSTKVKYVSGNVSLLSYSRIITGTFYFYTLDVTITGTALTRGTEGIMYISNNVPVINTGTTDIYIDKVVGYK